MCLLAGCSHKNALPRSTDRKSVEGAPELILQAARARLIAGWTPDGVNLWSVGKYGIIQHPVDGVKNVDRTKIAAPFQNCVLFSVLSIVALFNGYDEGDQHYGGNRSRSKNQQIERGPICVPDHVRKLTAWEDVAADALAARSAGKNLCPQSLPAQKGE